MNVEETSLLEEKMSGKGKVVADTGYGTNSVGAGAQMCNFSQILVGVSLFGQGVLSSIAITDNLGIVATIGS